MHCMSTKSDDDSSSHISFKAWTHTLTAASDHATHALATADNDVSDCAENHWTVCSIVQLVQLAHQLYE